MATILGVTNMANRNFTKALTRLAKGVQFFNKFDDKGVNVFKLQLDLSPNGDRFRGVVLANGKVFTVWETRSLDKLRRIACGYYPALCRAFGAARQYKGL
jgi:hypothetical protein